MEVQNASFCFQTVINGALEFNTKSSVKRIFLFLLVGTFLPRQSTTVTVIDLLDSNNCFQNRSSHIIVSRAYVFPDEWKTTGGVN